VNAVGIDAVAARVVGALRRGLIAVLLLPVHLWRATAVMRQPRCRYYPSCSTYAVGALRVHGPLRGSALAAWRLLRCHPWSAGGIDHVPPRVPRRTTMRATRGDQPAAPRAVQSVVQSVQQSGVRDA
jgi:putative membrane protein insertion efficiency factor